MSRWNSWLVLGLVLCPAWTYGQSLVNTLEIPACTRDKFPGPSSANTNRFGGFSDLYYHGPTRRWFALPDRGPGGGVIDYPTRVVEFTVDVDPTTGRLSAFRILRAIPFLTADGSEEFNGLNPKLLAGDSSVLGLSFDPEGFAIGPDGHFFVADEYGPSVYEFTPLQNEGRLEARFVRAFDVPESVIPRDARGRRQHVGDPATGRPDNRGFEGLAVNPSGTKLYTTLQSPRKQDGSPDGARSRNSRIYEFDLETGSCTAEYLYQYDLVDEVNARLRRPGSHGFPAKKQGYFALSGITALSDTEFLVIERDNRGIGVENPFVGYDVEADDVGAKRIYKVDLSAASDVRNVTIADNRGSEGHTPVSKKRCLDFHAELAEAGQVTPEKLEGITLGPKLTDGRRLLLLGTDNDFSATQIEGTIQYDIYTNGSEVRITPIDDPRHSHADFDPEGEDLGPIPQGFNQLPNYLYAVLIDD